MFNSVLLKGLYLQTRILYVSIACLARLVTSADLLYEYEMGRTGFAWTVGYYNYSVSCGLARVARPRPTRGVD
jgi:hypothetical protein